MAPAAPRQEQLKIQVRQYISVVWDHSHVRRNEAWRGLDVRHVLSLSCAAAQDPRSYFESSSRAAESADASGSGEAVPFLPAQAQRVHPPRVRRLRSLAGALLTAAVAIRQSHTGRAQPAGAGTRASMAEEVARVTVGDATRPPGSTFEIRIDSTTALQARGRAEPSSAPLLSPRARASFARRQQR